MLFSEYMIQSFRAMSIILLTLIAQPLFGQQKNFGSIKGRIVDKDHKQAIEGALIILSNSQISTQSDSLGYFEIIPVPTGSHSIEIKAIGYENQISNDINVLVNKSSYREISLQETIKTIKGIEVKAFQYENNRVTPVSSYSFSREEIALNPGSQGDIFRAIGMLPGVSSSGGIYSAIAVRGQGVRDNVYMVDDIPLTEVGHLEGNSFFNDPNGGRFSIFAPRVIENAQFQGGGFGPEYGRRSASYLGLGIKEGNKENSIIDGQVDLLGITINYDGPTKILKKTNIFLSARYQNFYGLVNLIGLKDIGLPIYGDVILKTTTELNAKNKLSFLAIVSPESYVRDIDNVYADKKLNLLYLPNFKRNKIVVGLNLRTLTSQKSYWKNVLYFTSYTSDVKVGKAYPDADSVANLNKPIIPYDESIQTQKYAETKLGYRSLFNLVMNQNQKLATGIEMDFQQLSNERTLQSNDTNFIFRTADLMNPNVKYQPIYPQFVDANFNKPNINFSSFINYSLLLGKKISLNTGLRYDYTGFADQHVISPRLSGSYYINEKNSFNFGYGLYFQDPVYSDIADQPSSNKLKMEEVSQYILGYRRYFTSDLKLTVEAWYKNFDNMVVTPINGTVLKNNKGTGWGKGLDINLTKRLVKKFHGQIGYSYIDIKRNDHDGIGAYDFAFSQPHQFNCMLSYKTNKHWVFSMKYRYATGKPKDNYIIHRDVLNNNSYVRYSKELVGRNELRLPDFTSLDLRANYNFKFKTATMTIFFDIVNVFNKQIANSENFNAITGQNFYDGLAIFPTGGMKFEF
jgi:hypothetical protein